MKIGDVIQVFRAGDYTEAAKGLHTVSDLQEYAETTAKADYDVPIGGVGHGGKGIFGAIDGKSLKVDGNVLLGKVKKLAEGVTQAFDEGRLSGWSAVIGKNFQQGNKKGLLRVDLCGELPPFIKGLKIQEAFSDEEALTIEFEEIKISQEEEMATKEEGKDEFQDEPTETETGAETETEPTPEEMKEKIEYLEKEIEGLKAENAAVKAENAALKQQIEEAGLAAAEAEAEAFSESVPAGLKAEAKKIYLQLATGKAEFSEGETPLDVLKKIIQKKVEPSGTVTFSDDVSKKSEARIEAERILGMTGGKK